MVDRRCADLPEADLIVLDYHEWREGLLRGLAAHHAGMLPVFRHTVEELFTAGLVKAVFATETLALGINMPARTVVLERLVKFNGEQHMPLTPGEYTQLTGRAGRRGIDVEGHAVVLWTPDVEPAEVAGLASTRTFPLRSSFAPSYNMTINLVHQMGPAQAHKLLESSFAQYQADRSVVGLVRGIERGERMLDEIAAELGGGEPQSGRRKSGSGVCAAAPADLGTRTRPVPRVAAATAQGRQRRAGSACAAATSSPSHQGRRGGLAVVLEPDRDSDDPRPLVLTEHRWAGRISSADYSGASARWDRCRCPSGSNTATLAHGATSRRRCAPRRPGSTSRRRRASAADAPAERDVDPELASLREQLRRHPAHQLPDREEKARLAERYLRIERDNEQIRQKVAAATNSLARTFDRIVVLLTERGFIDAGADAESDPKVTDDGRLLARIYSESDLLVAESLRSGIWEGLDAAELAAVVSAVLYESRGDTPGAPGGVDVPTGKLRRALNQTRRLWTELRADEQRHRISQSREPDEGFVAGHLPLDHHRRPGRRAGRVRRRGHRVSACRQAISCGGAAKCSTCSTRCATPRPAPRCGRPRNARSTTFDAASSLLMRVGVSAGT